MDPLSIVASSVAIFQAAEGVAKLLGQVKLLVDAPDEICLLIKEVEELKGLLGCLRQAEDLVSAISLPTDGAKNLKELIDEGCATLLELDKLISQEFIKPGTSKSPSGRYQVRRIKWVMKMSEVRKLKERLFNIRMSLSVQINSINLLATVSTKAVIQANIEQTGQLISQYTETQRYLFQHFDEHAVILSQLMHIEESHQSVSKGEPGQSAKLDISSRITLLENESFTKETDKLERDTTLLDASNAQSFSDCALSDVSTFNKIRTRIQQKFKCSTWCPCLCHKRTRLRTAKGLDGVMGTLSIQQNGVPLITAPCNNVACKKRTQKYTSTLVKFEYQFPRWLLSRILVFSVTCKSRLRPELLLRVQRIRPGNDPLFDRAWRGDTKGVQEILNTGKGSVLDVKVGNLWSALHVATEYAYTDIIKLLLSKGADPYQENVSKRSPFDLAWNTILTSSNKNSEKCQALQRLFPKKDVLDARQFSKLQEIILELRAGDARAEALHQETNVDYEDAYGLTALGWAAYRGRGDHVALLLECKADPRVADTRGYTPLHYAAMGHHPECMRLLLAAGADVNATSKLGRTAVNLVADFPENDSGTVFGPLIDANADLDLKTAEGRTPLYSAVEQGLSNHVVYLIEKGAGLDICNAWGRSCVMLAIGFNRHLCLDLLLQAGSNCLLVDADGATALHWAASCADVKTLSVLKNHQESLRGLDVGKVRLDKMSPLDIAEKRNGVSWEWNNSFANLLEGIMGKSEDHDTEGWR